MWYLLDENKNPYPVSLEESFKMYNDMDMKIVKQDKLDNDVFVSTVFLGLDHGWYGDKEKPDYKPVLFETMIFNGEYDGYQDRYTSYNDALKGHQEALDLVNKIKNQ